MEFCCCGNLLDKKIKTRVTMYPCKCDTPLKSIHRRAPLIGVSDRIPKHQVEERRRVGLPDCTDVERAAFDVDGRWV